MKELSSKIGDIPGRSAVYLVLCLVILIIFYFVGLYPYQRSMRSIDDETKRVKSLISKQRALAPLYQEMSKTGGSNVKCKLPVPQVKSLPRGDLDLVSSIFKDIADRNRMQIISITPDIMTVTEGSDNMMVTIHLRGDFLDFRKFLLGAGEVSSLKRMEEIQIIQETGYKDFYLKLILAIG